MGQFPDRYFYSGVCVLRGGSRGDSISVVGVCEDIIQSHQSNSILRKNEKIGPFWISSICPITESVVCLGCWDNNCHFYDFIENERIFTLEGHTNDVNDVTYYSKTSLLCSGSDDNTIRLWKVNTTDYTQSKEIYQLISLIGHANWVYCVRSREEVWPNRLLSGSWDCTGRIWDLTTQKQISVLGHSSRVFGIDLSSNGDYLVTGSYDETVCLWDTNTFEKQTTVDVGEWVWSLFCAQKRLNTIVVGGNRHVFIYDTRNLLNGPVNVWEGGEYRSQIVEIDSNRFVHNGGRRILRSYGGRVLADWDVKKSYGCCYVPPFYSRLKKTATASSTSLFVDRSVVRRNDAPQDLTCHGMYQIMEGMELPVTISRVNLASEQDVRESGFQTKEQVAEMVRVIADVVHANVLRCHGCYLEEDGTHVSILLENFEGGNLEEWLEFHFVGRLTKLRRVYILLEIARGLLHLHEMGLVLSDLSLDTVVVSSMDFEEAVVKLFPLSIRQFDDEDVDLGEDPIQFEVYLFGILCWEIWNGRRAPTRCRRSGVSRIIPAIAKCVGMPVPLQEMVASCWVDVPADRPPLREVVAVLGNIFTQLWAKRNATLLDVVEQKRPGDDIEFLRVLEDMLSVARLPYETSRFVFADQLMQLDRLLEKQRLFCSFLKGLLKSFRFAELEELLEHDLGPPSRLCFVGSLGAGKSSCINALLGISCCPIVRGSVFLLWEVRFGKKRSARLFLRGDKGEQRHDHDIGDSCFDSGNQLRQEELSGKKLTERSRRLGSDGRLERGRVVLTLPEPVLLSLRPIDTPAFGEFGVTDELVCTSCPSSLIVFVIRGTSLLYYPLESDGGTYRFTLSHNDSRLLLKLKGELESTIPSVEPASRFMFLITFVDTLLEVHQTNIDEEAVESDVFMFLRQDLFPNLRRDQVVSLCPLRRASHLLRAQSAISRALFLQSREILGRIQEKGDSYFRDKLRDLAASALRLLRFDVVPRDEDFLVRKMMMMLDDRICETLAWPFPGLADFVRRHSKRLRLLIPSEVVGPEEFQVSIPSLRRTTVYSREENRSRVGGGRFSIVLRAVQWKEGDEEIFDVVAVKRISRKDAGGASWSSETIVGFRREMEISLTLHHPNVVETYEIGADSDNWYIVMELCEGGSLMKLLTKNVNYDGIQVGITEDSACRFLLDAAAGLHYLHSFDPPLIHRDVNPRNFLLDAGGNLKICDFGTARHVKQAQGLTMTLSRGTVEYMAPELIIIGRVDTISSLSFNF